MTVLVDEAYRSVEVCRLAGCTYRQLDWWSRSGLFGDSKIGLGSGRHRTDYTGADVKVARALGRLSAAGLLGGGASGDAIKRLAGPIRAAAEAGREDATISLGAAGFGSVAVTVLLVSGDLSEP